MPAPDLDTLISESLALLEWPALLVHLEQASLTPLGRAHWQNPPLSQDPDWIVARLQEADDLLKLRQREGSLPQSITERAYPAGVVETLHRLAKGAPIPLGDWAALWVTLHQGRHWVIWLRRQLSERLTGLDPDDVEAPWHWLATLDLPEEAMATLAGILTLDGEILESASPQLATLKQTLRGQQKQLSQLLDTLVSRMGSMLQESYHTQRAGRYVLPVISTYKSNVNGILHDTSASGQTLYIEPQAIIEPHNRLLATQRAIEEEIERILLGLSSQLAPVAPALLHLVETVGRLDHLWSGAQLANRIHATRPTLSRPLAGQPPTLQLKKARHPLLALRATEDQPVIPNDLHLPSEVRTLIITGPNTGGKTVALKTVGLCALMVRSGLLLPVAAGSMIPLYGAVLADLGDAQSLTQNLSTFSGHVRRQAGFVALGPEILPGALVLMDEIGAGTDPVEGAALATVLLRELHRLGATTLVTTHLSALKWEAHQQVGYLNASMLFDGETLSPTYQLVMGVPGTSHALTIAQRLGVAPALIAQAQSLMSTTERDASQLLMDLEARQVTTEQDQAAITALKQELLQRTQALKEEVQAMREAKKQVVLEYRAGIKRRMAEVEQQLKGIRKQLQKQGESVTPSATRLMSARLRHAQHRADAVIDESLSPIEAETQAERQQDQVTVEVGKTVQIASMDQRGEVESLSADGKKAQVKVNGMRLTVPVRELTVVQTSLTAQAAAALKKAERQQILRRIQQSPAPAPATGYREAAGLQCDLRGQRVEDALIELERYLDKALTAGYEAVGVVHGIGTGALKKAVREYLAQQPFVVRFYPDQAIHGGDGKTIIELR